MLDIGWPELLLIVIVALVVIGPKDLPRALQTVGRWVRKARMLSGDFQKHIDAMVRESELDDLRKQAQKMKSLDVKGEIDRAIDPEGAIRKELADTPDPLPKIAPADDTPVEETAPVAPHKAKTP